eukprot:CAMPEP_0170464896 /NCGR_PEP_ID=MMETSP0123-20130129/9435_1 /TAXON_ID=182087 /ORGANISM="Favella ehrenbergii, Strain Fehren 1" /LENGTH=83 /DNA_ID=CAMNT_0010730641 /DNA_START=746 /DNA_END=998 /DNA_ORIENTATION=+
MNRKRLTLPRFVIDLDLRDGAVVPDEVLAFDCGAIPQAQLLVHGARDDPPIRAVCACGDPVCMAKSLIEKLAHLFASTQVVDA